MDSTGPKGLVGAAALARDDGLRDSGVLAGALVALVHAYRRHAPPALRESCRYEPTCSEYALVAIRRYGAVWGGARAFRRWRRCRPPYGGLDEP